MPISRSKSNGLRALLKKNTSQLTIVAGRVLGHATPGSASLDSSGANGVTLSYAATGVYTLTLPNRGGVDFVSILATVESTNDDDLAVVVTDKSETNGTVEFSVFDLATPTPTALAATDALNFLILLSE